MELGLPIIMNQWTMGLLGVLLLGIGLAVAYLVRFMVGLFVGNPVVHTEFLPPQIPDCTAPHTLETQRFTTADGVSLAAELVIPRTDPRGLVVFAPESCASLKTWNKYAAFLVEAGYALLAFDFRGSGLSDRVPGYEPKRWCSDREILDMDAALGHARTLFGGRFQKIPILGISRGAVASLVAASRDPLVPCVVVEGVPCTWMIILEYTHRWAEIWVPRSILDHCPEAVYRLAAWTVFQVSQFQLRCRWPLICEAGPLASGGKVLFIQGERDRHVLPHIGDEVYRSYGGPKERWVVPGARHGEGVIKDPDGYRRRVLDVIEPAV